MLTSGSELRGSGRSVFSLTKKKKEERKGCYKVSLHSVLVEGAVGSEVLYRRQILNVYSEENFYGKEQ